MLEVDFETVLEEGLENAKARDEQTKFAVFFALTRNDGNVPGFDVKSAHFMMERDSPEYRKQFREEIESKVGFYRWISIFRSNK